MNHQGARVWNAAEEPPTTSTFWEYLTGTAATTGSSLFETESNHPTETTSLLGRNNHHQNRSPSTFHHTNGSGHHSQEGNDILETPQHIHQSLQRLDEELSAIATSKKTVYSTAVQHSQDYVNSLKPLFLRAERFDAQKAAIRLVAFFEAKLRLFGPGIVGRPIRQSDLDPGDLRSLQSGCFQFLPSRDKHHRPVLCYFPNCLQYNRIENMIKAWWYLAMAMVEDDDQTQQKYLQRHGIVLAVHQGIGTVQLAEMDRALFWEGITSLEQQLPIRIVTGGVHYCFNDFMIRQMISLYSYYNWATDDEDNKNANTNRTDYSVAATTTTGGLTWANVHFHDASHTESQYNLLKFGIPSNELPVNDEEELENTVHLAWLAERMSREPSGTK